MNADSMKNPDPKFPEGETTFNAKQTAVLDTLISISRAEGARKFNFVTFCWGLIAGGAFSSVLCMLINAANGA
jgi:hypothetical protein